MSSPDLTKEVIPSVFYLFIFFLFIHFVSISLKECFNCGRVGRELHWESPRASPSVAWMELDIAAPSPKRRKDRAKTGVVFVKSGLLMA